MDQHVIIDALIQVARKRRLLAAGPAQRLGDYAKQKNISSLDDLRRWLKSGDGLSAHLANQLLEQIPTSEVKPFGPYVPLAHLADGGMGSVWLACSPKNELVVVKTLKNNLPPGIEKSQGTEFMRRFEREAKITMQLTHTNIVRCLDSGQAEDGHEPAVVLVQPENRWRECNSRMRWGHEQLRGLAPAGVVEARIDATALHDALHVEIGLAVAEQKDGSGRHVAW